MTNALYGFFSLDDDDDEDTEDASFSFYWQKVGCLQNAATSKSPRSIVILRRSVSASNTRLSFPTYSHLQMPTVKVHTEQRAGSKSNSVCGKVVESSNDQMLWSPPVDTEHDDNLTLVSKYLKLAAKERKQTELDFVKRILRYIVQIALPIKNWYLKSSSPPATTWIKPSRNYVRRQQTRTSVSRRPVVSNESSLVVRLWRHVVID